MADFPGCAVGRIESAAAFEEVGEFRFQRRELPASALYVGEFVPEERVDMAARCGAVVANVDDAGDLRQRQPAACAVRMNRSRTSVVSS